MGREWLHGEDLKGVMPAETPRGWTWDDWWAFSRGDGGFVWVRVYLNGGGSDHELRFIVRSERKGHDTIPCYRCKGVGRMERPKLAESFVFKALCKPGQEQDPVDEDGLRQCLLCYGRKTVPAMYGASNSFCNIPDLDDPEERIGERGLSKPSLEDTMLVFQWCDMIYEKLYRGEEVGDGSED